MTSELLPMTMNVVHRRKSAFSAKIRIGRFLEVGGVRIARRGRPPPASEGSGKDAFHCEAHPLGLSERLAHSPPVGEPRVFMEGTSNLIITIPPTLGLLLVC